MLLEGTSLTVGSHNVKVVRYLSEGGFSKIYEVTMDPKEGDTEVGCLKQVIVPDKNGLNTLRKEVEVMKTLRKARCIVKYYDSNAERLPDGSYQVLVLMELCPNNSLLDYMNERIRLKLTEPEILKIMLDISIGVYEMHKIKLIHRDIKIENVLIGAKKDFKLCDFGSVATPMRAPQDQHEFQSLSHDILYHTTPQYRSPEMIDLYRGFPIDERSDIWALGCFLYKLCYYTTPFEANGDIAILHASFQFPPSPMYSGDLKNLIIIMLQENPVYRPNIVQILILVAKLTSVDFSTLHIKDFYGAGEYNFQALHEMQKEKHLQLLRQQQYYLEQQKQQQAYDATKQNTETSKTSKSSSRASPSHLSRNSSVRTKDNETPVSSIKNELELLTKEEMGRAADDNAGHDNAGATGGTGLMSPSPDDKEIPSDSEGSEDLDVELPELDHIEKRFPSLDNIVDDVIVTGVDKPIDLNRASSVPKGRSSLDTNGSALERTSSREFLEAPFIAKTKSRTDLESVDAWRGNLPRKRDEKTEKLVDEIFSVGAGGLQRRKSSTSASSVKEALRTTHDYLRAVNTSSPSNVKFAHVSEIPVSRISKPPVVHVSEVVAHVSEEPVAHVSEVVSHVSEAPVARVSRIVAPVENDGLEHEAPPPLSPLRPTLDYASNQIRTVKDPIDLDLPVPGAPSKLNTYLPIAPNHDTQYLDISRSNPRRASYNPWGSALSSPKSHPQERPTEAMDINLHKHMGKLNLGPHFNATNREPTEMNLIDLEGPAIKITTETADQLKTPLRKDKSTAKAVQSAVTNSLIDMSYPDVNVQSEEHRPSFKKRPSDIPTQPLNFQEQVIDFESDDEMHNSEMSRVSIRKSLKNSRKHSDQRRSDSSHPEGKKRLSFFGGSSD